jgi:hypothetical protein
MDGSDCHIKRSFYALYTKNHMNGIYQSLNSIYLVLDVTANFLEVPADVPLVCSSSVNSSQERVASRQMWNLTEGTKEICVLHIQYNMTWPIRVARQVAPLVAKV